MAGYANRHMIGPRCLVVILVLFVAALACDGAGDDGTSTCGLIETFESGLSATNGVHVAPDGSDTDGDGSESGPYASVAHAVQDAVPGTAIRIHAGTYAGGTFLQVVRGTADAPIWIGGVEGESRPVLDGGGEGIGCLAARSSGAVAVDPVAASTTSAATTDCWPAIRFATWDDPARSVRTLPGTELGSIVGEDPALLVDYRIDASSPAAGAGVFVSGVSSDIDGVCYLNPPSIGAHEVF